jgi:hypothetical protein
MHEPNSDYGIGYLIVSGVNEMILGIGEQGIMSTLVFWSCSV